MTQAFNTTTSMGRLTLNMLLSFAQFEREITGERIRDKVAASKRKGIWMGGAVPLGYRVEDRALHVVEQEAEFVRSLFRRYLEVGSVVRLKTALDSENIRSPVRMSGTGKRTGGVPISRGHLYWILSNPIYVGRLRHKGQIHDGLHPAIIHLETWDRVQQKLESQTRARRISQPDDHSFLAGKLYDDRGNRMSSSHASKGGRRWRFDLRPLQPLSAPNPTPGAAATAKIIRGDQPQPPVRQAARHIISDARRTSLALAQRLPRNP